MNHNEQLIQIDNLLSHLKYYRGLSESEIMDSKDIIISFIYNLNALINNNIFCNEGLTLLYSIYDERVNYFQDLYLDDCFLIADGLENNKAIILEFYKSLKSDKRFDDICLNENEIEKRFDLILELSDDTKNQNTKIMEDFAEWFNNCVNSFGDAARICKSIYKYKDVPLGSYLNANYYECKNFYIEFLRIMVDIPRDFFVDQFIFFRESLLKENRDKFLNLSAKDLKDLMDISIVILAEFQNPCYIGEHGDRIPIQGLQKESAKSESQECSVICEKKQENINTSPKKYKLQYFKDTCSFKLNGKLLNLQSEEVNLLHGCCENPSLIVKNRKNKDSVNKRNINIKSEKYIKQYIIEDRTYKIYKNINVVGID